ncbi:hypothetical protein F4859DRAFT_513416 [Xylaria cf. heliscus]|nr:hypothetical protein F4859DRAFT_513416 [Xylaria cf. heliscus]
MKLEHVCSTDRRRWHLLSANGDHRWIYLDDRRHKDGRQSNAECYLLGLPLRGSEKYDDGQYEAFKSSFSDAARRGFDFFKRIQLPEGHWACEYGGPSLLLPAIYKNIHYQPQWQKGYKSKTRNTGDPLVFTDPITNLAVIRIVC